MAAGATPNAKTALRGSHRHGNVGASSLEHPRVRQPVHVRYTRSPQAWRAGRARTFLGSNIGSTRPSRRAPTLPRRQTANQGQDVRNAQYRHSRGSHRIPQNARRTGGSYSQRSYAIGPGRGRFRSVLLALCQAWVAAKESSKSGGAYPHRLLEQRSAEATLSDRLNTPRDEVLRRLWSRSINQSAHTTRPTRALSRGVLQSAKRLALGHDLRPTSADQPKRGEKTGDIKSVKILPPYFRLIL